MITGLEKYLQNWRLFLIVNYLFAYDVIISDYASSTEEFYEVHAIIIDLDDTVIAWTGSAERASYQRPLSNKRLCYSRSHWSAITPFKEELTERCAKVLI